ncbi:DUF2634 domain-containing protein [Oscillospiraceae bacterium OttesenSCG-928-F05]|nr:DUF2634 domain-containing protein [Oscillospiraceae bacterium OttesenSCG-928-F05]
MAGPKDTDIRLDVDWQLVPSASGDAAVISGVDCLLQDICLEAMTEAGDLFYAPDWGWSLLEFLQAEHDAMTEMEILRRIRGKLSERDAVDGDSIEIKSRFSDDILHILVRFSLAGDEETRTLQIAVSRIGVEVTVID